MTVLPAELKLADKVGGKAASRWQMVDVEDVTGHLYLWLVENSKAIERWRQEDGGEGKLFVSLRREAAKFCAAETEARIGRTLNANPAYPVDVLERALPFIFEDVPVTLVQVNPVTGEPLEVHGSQGVAQAVLADLQGAYFGMPPEVREVIAWRFRDGLTFEEIGELSNMTKAGAAKRVSRALQRMSEALGSD